MGDGVQGASAGHPLADEQAALDLISRLPADIPQALAELGGWVETLHPLSELKLARKFEIVDLVDRTARDFMSRLQSDYLSGAAGAQGAEVQVWASATGFLRQLFYAYLNIVRDFQTYALGWGQVRDRMPLLLTRALRVGAQRLKWQLMRYAPVEKELWAALAQLWSYAEDRGLTASRVLVYEDVESTPQRELLKPLMLAMSAGDSLSPRELDIAERIVAHYAERFELQRHPAKGCHFFLDIDAGAPPARYLPGTRVRPGVRFFGPGQSVAELEALSSSIATQESIPRGINLEGVPDIEQVVEVLGHLARYWWARRPGRTEERKRTLARIAVVHGYQQILAKLSMEAAVDLPLDDSDELWKVENESEGGYGAVLPLGTAEWVRVGTVLGVRAADSRVWGVGIVRRLAAREHDQRYVGIQLLGRGARIVTLRRTGDALPAMSALLLPSHVGDSVSQGEVTLLLPAGGFSSQAAIAMQAYSRDYLLEPRMLLETGDDYDMAYYRVTQSGR
jgi:hypothetical protein